MVMRADAPSLWMQASYSPASLDNSSNVEVFVPSNSSWPGLTRPSTSSPTLGGEDVDARHKAGHDERN